MKMARILAARTIFGKRLDMNKKRSYIIGVAAIIVCIIGFAAIYINFAPKPSAGGQKEYTLEVFDGNNSAQYSGKTDSEYLSGLLDELQNTSDFEYENAAGDYGTYIVSVNGIKADDSQKTYWAIYVNGEYGQYGADQQPVNDGDVYALKLESYE